MAIIQFSAESQVSSPETFSYTVFTGTQQKNSLNTVINGFTSININNFYEEVLLSSTLYNRIIPERGTTESGTTTRNIVRRSTNEKGNIELDITYKTGSNEVVEYQSINVINGSQQVLGPVFTINYISDANQYVDVSGFDFDYNENESAFIGVDYSFTKSSLLNGLVDRQGDNLSAEVVSMYLKQRGGTNEYLDYSFDTETETYTILGDNIRPQDIVVNYRVVDGTENGLTSTVFSKEIVTGLLPDDAISSDDRVDGEFYREQNGYYFISDSENGELFSTSLVEAGVEGEDYIYGGVQLNDTNNNWGRRGFSEAGDYWVKVKNQTDDPLIGNGQEIALVMGSADTIFGTNVQTEDILTGLQEGTLITTKSWTSYDGTFNIAAFDGAEVQGLMESGDTLNITRVDATTGEQIGNSQSFEAELMYTDFDQNYNNSLSAQNDFNYAEILAANVDPTLGLI